MKKYSVLVLCMLLVFALTACGHEHEWVEADCENPKACAECGETEGETLGHDWKKADCKNPKTCVVCGETEGETLEHDWQEGNCEAAEVCAVCQEGRGEGPGHKLHGGKVVFNDDGSVSYTGNCIVCAKEGTNSYTDTDEFAYHVVLGEWHAVAMAMGEMKYTLPEDMEDPVLVKLYEDGTGNATLYGELEQINWIFDGVESYTESAELGEMLVLTYHFDVVLDGTSYSNQMIFQIRSDMDRLNVIDYGTVIYYESVDVLGR